MSDRVMTLTQHLTELRSRLWVIIAAFAAGAAAVYAWSPAILDYFSATMGPFIFLTPAGALLARLKIAAAGGFFLSLPVMLFELWRFVSLGLTSGERRLMAWFLPAAVGLFAAGAALAVFIVAPTAYRFLLSFGSEGLKPMITVEAYLAFALFLAFSFGLVFEMPLAVVALGKMGLISHARLAGLRKGIYLGILIAAAVLTPGPDIISQILLAVPTIVLFELSLFFLRWEGVGRSVAKEVFSEEAT
ncbi:MAG: twin-arginine translocase subunit TatC [Elusimicrobia bacterium]|nr:twin-arginine translocase subunit TatC [Elusimicrobiota bacterium]